MTGDDLAHKVKNIYNQALFRKGLSIPALESPSTGDTGALKVRGGPFAIHSCVASTGSGPSPAGLHHVTLEPCLWGGERKKDLNPCAVTLGTLGIHLQVLAHFPATVGSA